MSELNKLAQIISVL